MFITVLLLFILTLLVYNYYVQYGRNGRLINLIPGPSGYPIVGNVFQFLTTSREELWKSLITVSNQYYPIAKIWGFFFSVVLIRHPDDLETILNSMKHTVKGLLYDILHPWLDTGLLTSEGVKWHSRRKILTPAFHFNILQQFVEILIEEGEKMTKSLKNTGGTVVKDLVPFLSEHTLNAICETAMGTSLRDLGAFQQRYRHAVHRMGELFVYRLIRQWLHPDWIFSLTSKGKEQTKMLNILHGFTEQVCIKTLHNMFRVASILNELITWPSRSPVSHAKILNRLNGNFTVDHCGNPSDTKHINIIIAERKLYHERTNGRYLRNFDNISGEGDDAESIETRKKRLALLDLLIAASREGLMTDLDIREEVDTFMFEGHDTTAMGLCFTLALLAEHKDIQDRVRNEIDISLQENEEKFTMQLLQQLPYLERCIKETMRLYPSVHLITRNNGEDVKLQSYLVPAGTLVVLNIYGVHRDPNFWPNPEVFDPDRFLPERIHNRHPYSYIPFSAGSRNCIGQRFAMLEMKAMVASLIHNFYLEPVDYLKDLRIQADLVLRPAHPFRVRFVPVSKINANF